jgi:hypothetical protein
VHLQSYLSKRDKITAKVPLKANSLVQENFDKRDNLEREKVSKRDKFPCYLTTFSGKKCLSGKVICAFFFPAYRSSPVYSILRDLDTLAG